jgi:hypothetical protein
LSHSSQLVSNIPRGIYKLTFGGNVASLITDG